MTTCKQCGAEIDFRETPNGKLQPVNPDTGEVHFATCSARLKSRPPAVPDHICASCGSLNTERLPGVGMHFGAVRCLDCRAHRWLRRPA